MSDTPKKDPYVTGSFNRKLYEMLDEWLTTKQAKLDFGFRSNSDVVNMLILYFLIDVTGDPELKRLADDISSVDRSIHSTVERFFASRRGRR